MFDHVTIRVSDVAASERFYELVLATVGIEDPHWGDAFVEWNDFSISQAREEKPVTRPARGVLRVLACACGRVLARGHRGRLSR